jgi:predicted DsbA family dithiol-disulfide isomerase
VVEDSGAGTRIQRLGLVANLNIQLHCLVLDGVNRRGTDGEPAFVEVSTPTDQALQSVLHKIITRAIRPHIGAVPPVIIDDRHLSQGGQPNEVFEQALRPIAAQR